VGTLRSQSKLAFALCLGIVVAGLAVLLWWQSDPGTASHFWHHDSGSILQFAVPPVIAAAGWAGQQVLSQRPGRSTPAQLEAARQALAGRGREWWRGIPEPAWPGHILRAGLRPLQVTWTTDPQAQALALTGSAADLTALTRALRQPGACRLVLTGPAGSGKSVLARLLMAELLKSPRSADPVPVFLPAWSWDPGSENLNEWMKRRIASDYPELADASAYGPSAIASLVDQGRILPIIDGLDALPAERRAAVRDDGQLMSQDRLILTCRTHLFDALDDFTVLAPAPVSAEHADAFLAEVTRLGTRPWAQPQRAADGPEYPPFLTYLTEPRLVYLASICYRDQNSAAAMAGQVATSPDDAQKQLVGGLIPALMPPRGGWAGPRTWYANRGKAEEWIGYLARLDLRDPADRQAAGPAGAPDILPGAARAGALRDTGNSRIAWWNLYRGLDGLRRRQAALRALVTATLAFAAISLEFTYDRHWQYSLMTGGAYALVVLIAGVLLCGGPWRPEPGRPGGQSTERGAVRSWLGTFLSRHWRVIVAALAVFCTFGVLIGLRIALENNDKNAVHQAIRTGLWDAVTTALIVVFTSVMAGAPARPRMARVTDVGGIPRSSRRTFAPSVVIGVLFGLLWGTTAVIKHQTDHVAAIGSALLTGVGTGLFFVLGCWIFAWTRGWFDSRPAPTPLTAARKDLAGAVVCALILGITFGFAFGVNAGFEFTGVDVVAWFIVGLALGSLGSEWPLYLMTICYLAARKRLPLRLMRFLECCRETGVMRVIGQEYQIHDDGLLHYLVGDAARQPARRRRQRERVWQGTLNPPAGGLADAEVG
jgi:hypothetical protein